MSGIPEQTEGAGSSSTGVGSSSLIAGPSLENADIGNKVSIMIQANDDFLDLIKSEKEKLNSLSGLITILNDLGLATQGIHRNKKRDAKTKLPILAKCFTDLNTSINKFLELEKYPFKDDFSSKPTQEKIAYLNMVRGIIANTIAKFLLIGKAATATKNVFDDDKLIIADIDRFKDAIKTMNDYFNEGENKNNIATLSKYVLMLKDYMKKYQTQL